MASSSLPALPCDKVICLGKSGFFLQVEKGREEEREEETSFPLGAHRIKPKTLSKRLRRAPEGNGGTHPRHANGLSEARLVCCLRQEATGRTRRRTAPRGRQGAARQGLVPLRDRVGAARRRRGKTLDAVTIGLDLTLRDVQNECKKTGHPCVFFFAVLVALRRNKREDKKKERRRKRKRERNSLDLVKNQKNLSKKKPRRWESAKVFRGAAVLGDWDSLPASSPPSAYLDLPFELDLAGRRNVQTASRRDDGPPGGGTAARGLADGGLPRGLFFHGDARGRRASASGQDAEVRLLEKEKDTEGEGGAAKALVRYRVRFE